MVADQTATLPYGVIAPPRRRGITVVVTSSNTASSWGAAPQVCGQYRTNSSMPISRKRPTMSWKYSTDCQGVRGGKQTRECRNDLPQSPAPYAYIANSGQGGKQSSDSAEGRDLNRDLWVMSTERHRSTQPGGYRAGASSPASARPP